MPTETPTSPVVPEIEVFPEEQWITDMEKPWHVILHDDSLHTYEYVVEMVCHIFKKSPPEAFMHAVEVDSFGRTILATLPKNEAEKKRDEVCRYGGDPRMNTTISMVATTEPAA